GRLPQSLLERIRAALVTTRNEGRVGVPNRTQPGENISLAFDLCRIGGRADDDEIVPRNLAAVDPMAFAYEFCFSFRIVDQDEIGIATPRGVERLTCAECYNAHGHPALPSKERQYVRQKPAVLDRRRRS